MSSAWRLLDVCVISLNTAESSSWEIGTPRLHTLLPLISLARSFGVRHRRETRRRVEATRAKSAPNWNARWRAEVENCLGNIMQNICRLIRPRKAGLGDQFSCRLIVIFSFASLVTLTNILGFPGQCLDKVARSWRELSVCHISSINHRQGVV